MACLSQFISVIPSELDDVLADTQQLIRLLDVLGDQQAAVEPFAVNCPEWMICRDSYQSPCDDLSALVTDLKSKVDKGRRTGSIRAVLNLRIQYRCYENG